MRIPWKKLAKWAIEKAAQWGVSKIGNSSAPTAGKKHSLKTPR